MVTEPISLIMTGGGPLGVAFQAGALIALEDILAGGFAAHIATIVGSSAGAVTGAFLAMGFAPEIIIKSMSGRFPDEIQPFDPVLLLDLERRQVPNLITAVWRSLRLIVSDIRKDLTGLSAEARRRRYQNYLTRIEELLNTIPKGWFRLHTLENFLCQVLSDRRGRLYRFDHLKRDLFICATDITDGRPVLFGKRRFKSKVESDPFFHHHRYVAGASLAHATVSSSAIPLVFLPYLRHGAILADGETRNTSALWIAQKLGRARLFVLINPLTPLRNLAPDCPTAEFTLQLLLTALEGNVAANVHQLLDRRGWAASRQEAPHELLYISPTPQDMKLMTEGSLVTLLSYRPQHAAAGYRAAAEALATRESAFRAALTRYAYPVDLSLCRKRLALIEESRDRGEAIEDALLKPRHELSGGTT